MAKKIECSIEDVRKRGADLFSQVQFGEGRVRLIVTKRGKPAVAIVSLEDLETLEKKK